MGNRIANFGLFLFLICCIVGGASLLSDATGALDLWRAQIAARQAEAEATKLQAELELTRAQSDVTRAQGEAAVLEAAARAVDSDRRLVTWYTLRGDLRGLLALAGGLGLAICGGILVVIVRGMNHESTDEH